MSQSVIGAAVTPPPRTTFFAPGDPLRWGVALLVLIGLIAASYAFLNTPGRGSASAFSLLTGAALGIVFERGRFCFFCILRDFIQYKNSTGLFAILAALAVGGIGYAIVFGVFLPNAFGGRLPPQAHIGPVHWVLMLAGGAFGVGMALSGACISGHLYRLGEGYTRAPFALFGTLIGFGIGFFTWQSLYLGTINRAPVAWLPATFGYGGSLVIHLAILGVFALALVRFLPPRQPSVIGKLTYTEIYSSIFKQRWNPLVTGALVGVIGVFAYLRVEPLGVTQQLGSLSRTWLQNGGLLADRLNGLDTFTGCATAVIQTVTDNGLLIVALVLGSFATAVVAGKFRLSKLTLKNALTALIGGTLMGWGAMTALGCTVGTLLSGISAFALSGWVFGAAVFVGVWIAIRFRLMD